MPLPSARVLCLTPLHRPDARLAAAVLAAGGAAALDAGADAVEARAALAELVQAAPGARFGVRPGAVLEPADLPAQVAWVVLPAGVPTAPWAPRAVLVEVTGVEQAVEALAAGAQGLVARGWESGGPVGEETGFVLVQQLVGLGAPVWVQAGLGPHGAAACVAGGAAGVVLDDQLLLLREARTPAALAEAVARMDGGETTVVEGVRGWQRPGRGGERLPLGAGAALAAALGRQHRAVAGLLRAYEAAIDEDLRLARALRPVAPGAPLAARWGLRHPIAQGPMTRVSDGAPFAAAVSDAGGLPFIALALMRGPQARQVLEETAARLAGRTWGVGILGFAPPELRQEQLEVLLDVKPPVVLIAGGRPSQARPLEQAGIETWLHVPSPGLLDLYLAEGARRFVFEGRESGGHVGPRGSLALWEAQVQRLLGFERLDEVSVLFAGGVHDGRSAAMVSVLAAPLAARGAAIGVLMGTAYLFTREAVETGAILPGFQEQALACRRTAVLETAPGHATRCVDTPFVAAFQAERGRLEAEGRDPKDIWAALEALNLGRLRIASKGLRRDGARLVEVDAEEQRRDGLYMIGQVAALHDRVVSVAELHDSVTQGAVDLLAGQSAAPALPAPDRPRPAPVDIAIIGMAAVFPDSPDLESFWAGVLDGALAIRDVPEGRWSARIFHDPESRGAAGGQTYCVAGGWLPAIRFDPLAYGIPPRSLVSIEPVQLLALEVARQALTDAGYAERPFDRERTAVVFGAEAGTELSGAYGFRTLYRQYAGPLPPELDAVLPRYTEDSFPGVLANVIAGRIANRLDLGGPNYTVDAACGSSLAALDAAVKELITGGSDLAIAGGADLHNGINDYVLFSSVHALSRAGRPRVFDASADGTIIGEGVAAVVLKRLADAERDGDRIYAVIKGVGSASDGKSLGLTAPRLQGQVRAVQRAYDQSGMPPARVELVEAHGTGTIVGDRTELAALTEVFADRPPGSCALGSVKSQIGHTKCAAGMAGLIKAALALHHRVLPPTLGVESPNPGWDADRSPFTLTGHARPWPGRDHAAGVSAFGFGGTNFHCVLEQAPDAAPPDVGRAAWPAELFLFRGPDRGAAVERVERLRRLLAGDEPWKLRELARAASTGGEGPTWIAVVAGDRRELGARLEQALAGRPDPRGVFLRDPEAPTIEDGARLAFLFPGQGSQRVGMLADLFVAFPWLQRYLVLGQRWAGTMHPPQAWTEAARAAQVAALTDTRVAQPALGVAGLAMAALLRRLGLRPALVGGHSYGELVALCVAGALDEAELLPLSEARADSILEVAGAVEGGDAGTMAAVSASADEVAALLAGHPRVVLANHNAPDQVVLAGPTDAVTACVGALAAAGLAARPIPVAAAFHSPVIAGADARFAQALARARVRPPTVPVWSNTTAAPYPAEPDAIRARLAGHLLAPVRFVEQVEAMAEAGAGLFVEVGPGGVLTRLVGRTLHGRPHRAVAIDDGRTHGLVRLQLALAALAVQGAPVQAEALFEGRPLRRFDLAHPPPPSVKPTDWLIDGHLARPLGGPLPEGAMLPVTEPVVQAAVAAPPAEAEREKVVSEYLDTMRRLVDAQRDVMLRYLGTAPVEAVAHAAPAAPPVEAAPAPAAQAPEAAAEAEAADLQEVLLGIVSERTGYPLEMLDLDLDLEADLSIDSIKRIEILGLLGDQVGLRAADASQRDAVIEQLAGVRTLRGILAWLEERQAGEPVDDEPSVPHPMGVGAAPLVASPSAASAAAASAAAASAAAASAAAAPAPVATPEADTRLPLRRFVVTVAPLAPPAGDPRALAGRRILLADDGGGVATALASVLARQGAHAEVVGPAALPSNGEDLVDLTGLDAEPEPARHLFGWVRSALGGPERRVLAVTGLGGALGAPREAPLSGGPAGLLRTVARERPELQVRVVDVDPGQPADRLADLLANELAAAAPAPPPAEVEVGWSGDVRVRQVLEERPVLAGEAPHLRLDPEAVLLVTGGARGIGARCTLALARRFPCRVEVVGRSPLSTEPLEPALQQAPDRLALRQLLVARGGLGGPREIEAACDRILARREVEANLAALRATGATVRYHAVDVRDADAFGGLIEALYEEHGRLDGVIHAAGITEDRLVQHKTPESFDRVYDTKVKGARVIARRLRPGAAFVVFFGSVSGVLGNRGQVDYAAANDALDKLARALDGRLARRVVSIDWGPWSGGGMVSPELEREYARRGVGLIVPEEGADAFVDELLHGQPGEAQVLWMCGSPDSLA